MNVSTVPNTARLLVALLLFATLTGCGYQLRGVVDLPPQMQRVYIQSDARHPGFVLELKQALIAAGAEVTAAPASATSVLKLVDIEEQRVTTGRDINRNAAQYRVGLAVTYETRAATGGGVPLSTSVATQQFSYDPTLPVEMERQERTIFAQMTRNVVAQMIRRLARAN